SPVATDDSGTTAEDTPLTIDVIANDSDADGDSLSIFSVTQGTLGSVAIVAGNITYTPNANVFGNDTFSYTVSDGHGGTALGNVTVSTTPVNDAPSATPDAYTTAEDTPLTISGASGLLANDSDIDGDTLTASRISGPSHGNLTLNSDGSFIYTPDANYF